MFFWHSLQYKQKQRNELHCVLSELLTYFSCVIPTKLCPSTFNNWSPACNWPSWRHNNNSHQFTNEKYESHVSRNIHCKWIQNYGIGIVYYKENIMVLYICLSTECWCDNLQTLLLKTPFTGHDSVPTIPYPHTSYIYIPKININIPSSSWSTKWMSPKRFSHLSSTHINALSPPFQPHTQPVYS